MPINISPDLAGLLPALELRRISPILARRIRVHMRKNLTDKGIAALKSRAARYAYPDPEMRGHYVRVQPSGAKSFVAVTLDPHGKQVWATLGSTDVLGIDEAREKARSAIKRIKEGKPAFE